jgi:hypothetical protein
VRGERRRADRLIQVERVAAGQDGQVDGLAYLLGRVLLNGDRTVVFH